MSELSQSQIVDAAGAFSEAATIIGGTGSVELDRTPVPSPSYNEIAATYGVEPGKKTFEIQPGRRTELQKYPGLRVTVGVMISDKSGTLRKVYLPGIVLDGQSTPKIGCLQAAPDVMTDEATLSVRTTRPLTDLQQTLLGQLYGMHKPGVGTQAPGHSIQMGETAHASLVAITASTQTSGLHGRVHDFASRGLAPSIAATQALNIAVKGSERPVSQTVVPAEATSRIIVSREHQLPDDRSGLQIGAGELAVGVALAAVRTKPDFPQPDLRAGMATLLG